MQLTSTVLVLGSVASLATAHVVEKRAYQFLDFVPMHKRQVTGPAYQCHSDCGYTILNARDNEGYCDDAEWKGLLEACLACANEYDLWPDYGRPIEAAASACGIDAVPADGGSDATTAAATTAAAETTAAATSAAETTSVDDATEAASTVVSSVVPPTTAAASPSVTVTESVAESVTSAAATTTAVVSSAPPASTSAVEEVPTTVNGASANKLSGLLAVGAAVAAVMNLM